MQVGLFRSHDSPLLQQVPVTASRYRTSSRRRFGAMLRASQGRPRYAGRP